MDILKMAMDNLPDGALESVAGAAGIDSKMVGNILEHAAPSMAGALGNKIKEDGSFLDKAIGATGGGGLLDMVMGSQVENIANQVASKFGVSSGIVKTVLEKILPYILDAVKGGKISPEMLSAAAGLADGVDMSDVQNIAGAVIGKKGGVLGMIGGLFGKK